MYVTYVVVLDLYLVRKNGDLGTVKVFDRTLLDFKKDIYAYS